MDEKQRAMIRWRHSLRPRSEDQELSRAAAAEAAWEWLNLPDAVQRLRCERDHGKMHGRNRCIARHGHPEKRNRTAQSVLGL